MLRRAGAHAARSARLLEQGDVQGALEHVTPVGAVLDGARTSRPKQRPATARRCEIRQLDSEHRRAQVNYDAISRAFGTPKPTLANSYEPELLNLRTFPTLMGYSSRIMAESWESNTALLGGAGG